MVTCHAWQAYPMPCLEGKLVLAGRCSALVEAISLTSKQSKAATDHGSPAELWVSWQSQQSPAPTCSAVQLPARPSQLLLQSTGHLKHR